MNKADLYFKETVTELLKKENSTEGELVRPSYKDGTKAHTYYLTNKVFEYDLSKGEFPISNVRPLAWKSAIKEILVIYQKQTSDLTEYRKVGINWWDEFDIGNGSHGLRYGATLRRYDLVNKLLNDLKNSPMSRRLMINMYQYSDFEETEGLFPCCYGFQLNVRGEYLDMVLNQRSQDYLMTHSLNPLQYAALLMMLAKTSGYLPGKITHIIANVHFYDRHLEQAEELAKREVSAKTPKLIFNPETIDFYSFKIEDFSIVDYEPCLPQVKLELAI